jgi:hypothetical protein
MSVIHQTHQVGVDHRDETVTVQQPGYAMTEQVTRDVAAERRLGWSSACFALLRIVPALARSRDRRVRRHLAQAPSV